jgi:hypothetical protein
MSKNINSQPFLPLNKIEAVRDALTIVRGQDGWLLGNRIPEKDRESRLILFVNNCKVEFQLNVILKRVKTLKMYIANFSIDDFDFLFDEFNKYKVFDENGKRIPFDPYKELDMLLMTDGIEDLPFKIEEFSELLNFTKNYSLYEKARREAFYELFGQNYSEHKTPDDLLINTVIEAISTDYNIGNHIEIEDTFTHYNKWYTLMTRLVSQRKPFTEMLPLFK